MIVEPQARPARNETDGLAIASLVLGIFWLLGVGSLLAVVFGYMARARIRRSGGGGSGLALAGLILGWVGLAGAALLLVLGVAIGHAAKTVSGASVRTGSASTVQGPPAQSQNAAPQANVTCSPVSSALDALPSLSATQAQNVISQLTTLRTEFYASGNSECITMADTDNAASGEEAALQNWLQSHNGVYSPLTDHVVTLVAPQSDIGDGQTVTFHMVATNGTGTGTFQVLLDHSSGHWKFASISRLGS